MATVKTSNVITLKYQLKIDGILEIEAGLEIRKRYQLGIIEMDQINENIRFLIFWEILLSVKQMLNTWAFYDDESEFLVDK